MQFFAGIFGGLILAALGAMLVTSAFAAFPEKGAGWGVMAFLIFWAVGIVVALSANTAAKAWRRLCLISIAFVFLISIGNWVSLAVF